MIQIHGIRQEHEGVSTKYPSSMHCTPDMQNTYMHSYTHVHLHACAQHHADPCARTSAMPTHAAARARADVHGMYDTHI